MIPFFSSTQCRFGRAAFANHGAYPSLALCKPAVQDAFGMLNNASVTSDFHPAHDPLGDGSMDSINRNQDEENRADLGGRGAIEKIRELVEKAETCFFCTEVPVGGSGGARPMSVRKIDAEGRLWFLSASDSHKNREILMNPSVKLFFQGSPHSDFLQLNGRANLSTNRQKIEELWSPILKTWFTEGIDDPRITVIEVTPVSGYYWDTQHGSAVAGIKMLIGATLGKTMDDSIEGALDPDSPQ